MRNNRTINMCLSSIDKVSENGDGTVTIRLSEYRDGAALAVNVRFSLTDIRWLAADFHRYLEYRRDELDMTAKVLRDGP